MNNPKHRPFFQYKLTKLLNKKTNKMEIFLATKLGDGPWIIPTMNEKMSMLYLFVYCDVENNKEIIKLTRECFIHKWLDGIKQQKDFLEIAKDTKTRGINLEEAKEISKTINRMKKGKTDLLDLNFIRNKARYKYSREL